MGAMFGDFKGLTCGGRCLFPPEFQMFSQKSIQKSGFGCDVTQLEHACDILCSMLSINK